MIWSTTPIQDASIYESDPYRNAGLDEILDLQAGTDPLSGQFSETRVLVKFDIEKWRDVKTLFGAKNYTASLVFHTVQSSQLPTTFILSASMVGDNWNNGTGYTTAPAGTIGATYASDGVTWINTSGYGTTDWERAADNSASDFGYNSVIGGGDWKSNDREPTYLVTQSFCFKQSDAVQFDITAFVDYWLDSPKANHGVLVKFNVDDSPEFESGISTIQLYSSETHTVYEPQLMISWPTSAYSATSSSASFNDDVTVYCNGFKSEYPVDKCIRIMLGSRPRFPRRTFQQNSNFSNILPLPENTYFQVRDVHSNEIIIPWSESTKLTTDDNGSQFDFYTTMLYPERYYQFELIVRYDETFSDTITSNEFIFKIVR